MIDVIKYILTAIYLIVAIVLTFLAMSQSKEDAGAGETIMGSSTNNFYEKNKGRSKEGKLKRWTIILGSAFAALTIILGIVYGL